MPRKYQIALSLLITLALLAGFTAQRMSYPGPDDAAPYHAKVAALIKKMPETIGPWRGKDTPIPSAAMALLKPNATCSRQYTNINIGQSVQFLIVQCRDARDMQGHYPPICYPAHGWISDTSRPCVWQLPGFRVNGMEYEYHQTFPMHTTTMYVDNVILLPDGKMADSIDAIYDAAADYRTHFFGAAQFQIVFSADTKLQDRRQIATAFLTAAEPIIKAIGDGVHS